MNKIEQTFEKVCKEPRYGERIAAEGINFAIAIICKRLKKEGEIINSDEKKFLLKQIAKRQIIFFQEHGITSSTDIFWHIYDFKNLTFVAAGEFLNDKKFKKNFEHEKELLEFMLKTC